MKIETKFKIGDMVTIKGHTGPVTDISFWASSAREGVEAGVEIEYRIDSPSGAPMNVGIWAHEEQVEAQS